MRLATLAGACYLGPGADAERARCLATLNLANRRTPRALALVAAAERAGGVVTGAPAPCR